MLSPPFQAGSIEALLRQVNGAPLKKRRGSVSLAREEDAYGEAFSADLAALVRVQEQSALPRVGGWTLLGNARPLGTWKRALTEGGRLLPVLCALYPIAENQGEDVVFATLRPAGDPRSWLYLFEGEESESLQRTHFSIAHFVWSHALASGAEEDPLFGAEDDASVAFAEEQAEWTVEPLEDPMFLFGRAEWLLRAFAERGEFTGGCSNEHRRHRSRRTRPALGAWPQRRVISSFTSAH